MNVTVRITKPLQKFIPTQKLCIDVHDYNDVYSALKNMFPDFESFLNNTKKSFQDVALVQNKKVVEVKKFKFPVKEGDIYVSPIFYGHAYGFSDLYSDIQSSFMFPLFGLSTAGSEQMDFEGMDKRVRDSSLFGRAEDIYDVGMRKENDIFGALSLDTTANNPVPINYGLVRVSGTVINAYVKNYRADPDEFKVSEIVDLERGQ